MDDSEQAPKHFDPSCLEREGPTLFGYYSAIHLANEKPNLNPVKQGDYPTNFGEEKIYSFSSGCQLVVTENGVIYIDLATDKNFSPAVFPPSAKAEVPKAKHQQREAEIKNSQNRQLARLILRAHQAFLEGAIHSTASGGAVASFIDGNTTMCAVHDKHQVRTHPWIKRQWHAARHHSVMPWQVSNVAFAGLARAEKAGGISLLRLVELYQVANRRFRTHEYNESISLSWLVCEAITTSMWKDHFKKQFIESGRESDLSKSRLAKFSRQSGSLRLELLDGYGLLSTRVLGELKLLKKARNSVMHEVASVSLQDALQGLRACKDLFFDAYGLKLTVMQTHVETHGGRWIKPS